MAEQPVLKQIVGNIIDSNNVLVTVSANPSVDELSAALGITLLINKLDKHATAVFSGAIPPAIEFLSPHKTFENTVDSLRDFIIALDKNKADHLRYKVVDDMVKIFITPYRTTINEKDLDFSQGDYNVETVLAIGVKSTDDLDHALEAHGRILHDATVATISLGDETKLGGIEWTDRSASSYSEMLYNLAEAVRSDKKLIDEQIATAFLTGIVAATERFSNNKTSAHVMTIAAQLMADGANQQLIAAKLEEEHEIPAQPAKESEGDLKEGKSAKIDKSGAEAASKKKVAEDDGSIGALTISHLPEGDVDEVAEQVAAKHSEEAAHRAEELAQGTTPRTDTVDEKEAAEDRLASQLAANEASRAGIPSVADIQRDIARANNDVEQGAEEPAPSATSAAPAPGGMPGFEPIALDKWSGHPDREAAEPSLGGTLNATAEQAHDDTEATREDDKNKTILSHGGTLTNVPPAFQAPLNAVNASLPAEHEPQVQDIFAQSPVASAPTNYTESVQPSVPEPTLADIDSQNRAASNARAAADAAFANVPDQPPLPPLPPMPDFSTLPPLPNDGASPVPQSDANNTTMVPDTLGNVLPPTPQTEAAPAAPTANDPAQFRIPGQ